MKKLIIALCLASVIILGTACAYTVKADSNGVLLVKFDKEKEEVKKDKKKKNVTVQDVKPVPANNESDSDDSDESFNNDELIPEDVVVEGDCTRSGFDRE